MTNFVKCIDNTYNTYTKESLTNGKIYEVIERDDKHYLIINNTGNKVWYDKENFEEVKESTTNKFRFIPKTEITEVIVDGIEGVLIKE